MPLQSRRGERLRAARTGVSALRGNGLPGGWRRPVRQVHAVPVVLGQRGTAGRAAAQPAVRPLPDSPQGGTWTPRTTGRAMETEVQSDGNGRSDKRDRCGADAGGDAPRLGNPDGGTRHLQAARRRGAPPGGGRPAGTWVLRKGDPHGEEVMEVEAMDLYGRWAPPSSYISLSTRDDLSGRSGC